MLFEAGEGSVDELGAIGKLWRVHFYPETVCHYHQICRILLDPEKVKYSLMECILLWLAGLCPSPSLQASRTALPQMRSVPALAKHPPDCCRLLFYHLPPVLSCQWWPASSYHAPFPVAAKLSFPLSYRWRRRRPLAIFYSLPGTLLILPGCMT